MAANNASKQRKDLDVIARQLGEVKLQALPKDGKILLKATAKFGARTCSIGEYKVAFGLNQAILHVECPSFDKAREYSATLSPNVFSESWKESRKQDTKVKGKAGFGVKLFSYFSLGGEVAGGRESSDSAEQRGKISYPLITAIPGGWRIGSELGDPRVPRGVQPKGLENCLDGEYFSGQRDEAGEGEKIAPLGTALCVLTPKEGGNDLAITATLLGVSGSLQISLEPLNEPKFPGTKIQETTKLRQAFIEILVNRTKEAGKAGAATEDLVSGDYYLHHHTIMAPKIPELAARPASAKTSRKQE
jgi:hypothetical protein